MDVRAWRWPSRGIPREALGQIAWAVIVGYAAMTPHGAVVLLAAGVIEMTRGTMGVRGEGVADVASGTPASGGRLWGRGLKHAVTQFSVLLALAVMMLAGSTARLTSGRAPLGGALSDADPRAAADQAHLLHGQVAKAQVTQQWREMDAAVTWYLAHMSLDDQLGQMLLNGCSCGPGPAYTADLATMVERQHIGGIILFGNNYGSFAQTQQMVRQMQAHARIPLFVGTDQEGGSVSRVAGFFGAFPSERALANTGSLQVTYDAGRHTAGDLQQLGINVDFAPVVDVPVDGGGVWSAFRTYSTDPHVAAQFAGAFMAGLQSANEISCLKHFPGIGSIHQDPHDTLPIVTRSLSQMRRSELYPYQVLIPHLPDMIMATDVLAPAVDAKYPAELSSAWVTGILRQQLGYDGVVITDSLWMKGITDHWSLASAAVQAVVAGDDIVLAAFSSSSTQSVLDALRAAVASGRLTRPRIEQSVRRILALKLKYGLLPIPPQVLAAYPPLSR